MEYFEVCDFAKTQHYKDRNPQWIKLYNNLFDDYLFCSLPDETKYHFIAIMLLASRSTNKLPYDIAWISSKIEAHKNVDLDLLLKLKFINKINSYDERSKALAECYQDATLEKRREEKRREENIKEKIYKKEKFSDLFLRFWNAYPKQARKEKEETFTNFKKLKVDEALLAEILDAIKNQTLEREIMERKNSNPPQWKHSKRWLKDKRWLDEVDLSETVAPQRSQDPFSANIQNAAKRTAGNNQQQYDNLHLVEDY